MKNKLYVVLLVLALVIQVLPNVYAEPTAEPMPAASAEPEATASAEPEVTASAEPEVTASAEPEATSSAEPEATASAEPETTPAATPDSIYLIDGTHLGTDNVELANYNPETKEYTAKVYLESERDLMAGTFGMQYDPTLSNNIVFQLNNQNFDIVEDFSDSSQCYVAFSWTVPHPDATPQPTVEPSAEPTEEPITEPTEAPVVQPSAEPAQPSSDPGEVEEQSITGGQRIRRELGTITISGVEIGDDGNPVGWHTKTLRQLDWYTTPTSAEDRFTNNDDGICLNDQTFNPVTGWYQGQDMTDWFKWAEGELAPEETEPPEYKWVDIGFVFKSGYDLPVLDKVLISGTVKSYNPKNPLELTLYDDSGEEVTLEPTDITIIDKEDDHGRVVSAYAIYANIVPGDYKIKIAKKVHLTYNKKIVVSGDTASGGVVTLYCGDINADEKIKLNDRASLLNCMNRQNKQNATNFDICDLNGDGKVTMFDLNILKQYFNKSYVEVIPYVQK